MGFCRMAEWFKAPVFEMRTGMYEPVLLRRV
jgi:hypothetical protein